MSGRVGWLRLPCFAGLGRPKRRPPKRAEAYGLFPDVDRVDTSLEAVCGATVGQAFGEEIEGKPLLLAEGGSLTLEKRSVAIPVELFDIWPADQAAAILDEEGRPALCRHIGLADRKKLLKWGVVDEIDKQKLLETLQTKHLPRPQTWHQLLNLWAYVAPEITGYRRYVNEEGLRIVPVQGRDVLYSASEAVRLGERKLLQSEDDWQFLAEHLIVLNQNWPRFLAEQRRTASEHDDESATEAVEGAYAVLQKIGFDNTSDVNKVIDQVAGKFFCQASIGLRGCVRLAQIAAKLGATAGEAFKYATSDKKLHSAKRGLLFDSDGSLSELLPEPQRDSQVLHPDYTAQFFSCSREDWLLWISSGRAGLRTFVPIAQSGSHLGRRRGLEEELKKRDFVGTLESRYKDPWFSIQDWDFDQTYWQHWHSLETENPAIWSSIAERILSQNRAYWSRVASAQIVEEASNGHQRPIANRGVTPSWALKLRDLPCLPDTRGFHRKPGELLRRTAETEALIEVEPFVHGLLDRETSRPLLDLIGVRSAPTGPDRLLNCLRALANAASPPVHEVEKWYNRLDQIVDTCSTEDFEKIRQAFQSEKLILTQNGVWDGTPAVFLASDEDDVPDAEVIRASVNDLTLWRKIGVADRPTAELAIQWLKTLPPNKALEQNDARRVRSLLRRFPIRIWEEARSWLNLAGEWVSVDGVSYSLTMQSLVPWRHLHQWVRQKTADLQGLSTEITGNPPFSQLPTLATHVEERFHRNPRLLGSLVKKEWLTVLGHELRRIELDAEDDTQRVRGLANNLAQTTWRKTPGLEIVPYIHGTPAGTPRHADVLWLEDTLYVDDLPKAKLARCVPQEIGKAFRHVDIQAALDYSFERSAQDVRDYLEENFKLCPTSAQTDGASDEADLSPTEDSDEREPTGGPGSHRRPCEPDGTDAEGFAEQEEEQTENSGSAEPDAEREPDDVVETELARPRPSPRHAKPDMIELYAKSQGFRKDSDDRFFHEDGSWIARANGTRFPWERRTASGDIERYYWPKGHCLEREPLQLEADVWDLMQQRPEIYALVLADIQGGPVEITGSRLRAMRDQGKVTLYPATYRLVYDDGGHS